MRRTTTRYLAVLSALTLCTVGFAAGPPPLSNAESAAAAADYQTYCALCHGEDRQGHVNDHAPSLRSKSLLGAGFQERIMATAYGRRGTPMGGYLDEIGGPMSRADIYRLTRWLQEQVSVEIAELPMAFVNGDADLGAGIYARDCAQCHGASGEGITGTALGNAAMLSLTTDAFLRRAIVKGRDGTEMAAFGDKLTNDEINAVTAFLRSRATGWALEKPVFRTPPTPDQYVLNPDAADPDFDLRDGLYVMSADLDKALADGRKMVLLDTRVTSLWQMAHIEGAVPLPYYYNAFDKLAEDLPTDDTWIVTYCECPRAAAESVTRRLREEGFGNTAVLYEGIMGWVSLGYPVSRGESTLVDSSDLH